MHTLGTHPAKLWALIYLVAALVAWNGRPVWPATVSMHTFGRYEFLVQEGLPVAAGEILGLVRRQTGLPEYPLVLGTRTRALELSLLGPGNRPIRLASTPFTGSGGTAEPSTRFIVERSVRQDSTLTLSVRQVSAPRQLSLAVDLQKLEQMLEGPR